MGLIDLLEFFFRTRLVRDGGMIRVITARQSPVRILHLVKRSLTREFEDCVIIFGGGRH